MNVQVGDLWEGQRSHKWIVRVVRTSAASVTYDLVKGHGRKTRHHLLLTCFFRDFAPYSVKRHKGTVSGTAFVSPRRAA